MLRIAILGGSFDPPSRHHRELAQRLAERFDRVIVVPTVREDRLEATDTDTIYRATLADISFRGLNKVEVDLSDLENETATEPWEMETRLSKQGEAEVWFVVPAELVRGGRESPLALYWDRAGEMWKTSHFLILHQPNEPLGDDLPAHFELLEVKPFLPAASIRLRVYHHESIAEWVLPEIDAYIERHGLYRGVRPCGNCAFRLNRPRFRLFFDSNNGTSAGIAAALWGIRESRTEMIVVIGGDGTMLRAIRHLWRERLPFYGVNTGHLGFLLNDNKIVDDGRTGFWDKDLQLYQLPLLWTEVQAIGGGDTPTGYAFNEVWAERASGQTAWVKLSVNGHDLMPRIACDGVLVSTAAGSTSYARAMGAVPVPFTTPVLIVAGSNVLTPMNWRPAVVPITSQVELSSIDPDKRPLYGYMDGVSLGEISSMRVRTSRIAAVELAFQAEHDPSNKLTRLQFNMNGGS